MVRGGVDVEKEEEEEEAEGHKKGKQTEDKRKTTGAILP